MKIGLRLAQAAIAVAAPLLSIMISAFKATTSGYSEDYLTDPGHKRIKMYDRMIVNMAVVLVIAAFAYTYNFDLDTFLIAFADNPNQVLLGAQFSGTASFIILYLLSGSLYLYDLYRDKIIRRINESHGAW